METLSSEILTVAAQNLLKGIPRDHDYFDDFYEGQLAGGWEAVGEIKMTTATARNPSIGLFGKAYSPYTGLYSEQTFKALQELAKTQLSRPFLMPVHYYSGENGSVILFPLGEDSAQRYIDDYYSQTEIYAIGGVAVTHGLTPLMPRFNKVAIVKINGIEYATDVFEDSHHQISQFVEHER